MTQKYTEEDFIPEQQTPDESTSAETTSEVSFDELPLNSSIRRAIREMGFASTTPIQAQAIPVLLTGRDVIGQAQTGTGKTAAFGLPILQRIDPDNKNLQAVILCPTRELAMQAANDLRAFAKYMHDVKVLPVYGGQDIVRQIRALKGVQIIVGTPGRVMDHMRRHTIRMDQVSMVVLDEADEMLNMGFREDMEVILGAIDHPHQTCLFSATMPKAILDLTDQYQKHPQLIKVTQEELTMENIHQYYYAVKREYKTLALVRLLNYYHYKRCVIFCNTKAMVDELATHLQEEGYTAEGLHGDLTQKQRDYVMGRFRAGSLTCLIATDIAARGIDVDNVEAVFNYDLPQETEYYVHRIGRTGRAGKEGSSHTLCRSRDFQQIHEIEKICHATMEERRIPTPAQIREGRERQTLDKVMTVLSEGHSGSLIPVIREYCQTYGISSEAFAAAFLRMELGDDLAQDDNIEIDLPSQRDKHRGRRRSYNRFEGFESNHRGRGKRNDDRIHTRDRKHDHDRDSKDDKRRNNKKGRDTVHGRYRDHSFTPDKKPSDLRMNGEAFRKRKRKEKGIERN